VRVRPLFIQPWRLPVVIVVVIVVVIETRCIIVKDVFDSFKNNLTSCIIDNGCRTWLIVGLGWVVKPGRTSGHFFVSRVTKGLKKKDFLFCSRLVQEKKQTCFCPLVDGFSKINMKSKLLQHTDKQMSGSRAPANYLDLETKTAGPVQSAQPNKTKRVGQDVRAPTARQRSQDLIVKKHCLLLSLGRDTVRSAPSSNTKLHQRV
jgi:hypothetical protein